ncbi:MAG: hypothetical protein WC071_04965 [Victivallaceae bacterium]
MLDNENIARLELIADGMGELVDKMVFLGGSVTNLYIDDPAAEHIRPTMDVDCIVEVKNKPAFHKLEEELRQKGFCHCTESGAPVCRWVYKDILVDIMPVDECILGFANRWYSEGIRNSQKVQLPGGQVIFVLKLPYFIATKIEAYYGRGERDFRISHDIEDIINVLDGVLTFEDFTDLPDSLKSYLIEKVSVFLDNPQFIESISSNIEFAQPSPGRVRRIINFLRAYVRS